MYCEKEFFRVDVSLPSVVQTPRRKAKMKNGKNLLNIYKRINTLRRLLKTAKTCDINKPNDWFIYGVGIYLRKM